MSLRGRYSASINCHNSLDFSEGGKCLCHLQSTSHSLEANHKPPFKLVQPLFWHFWRVWLFDTEIGSIYFRKYGTFHPHIQNLCRHCKHSKSWYNSRGAQGQVLLLPPSSPKLWPQEQRLCKAKDIWAQETWSKVQRLGPAPLLSCFPTAKGLCSHEAGAASQPDLPAHRGCHWQQEDLQGSGVYFVTNGWSVRTETTWNCWASLHTGWETQKVSLHCSSRCEQAGAHIPSLLSLSRALNSLSALFVLSIALCAKCDNMKIYLEL